MSAIRTLWFCGLLLFVAGDHTDLTYFLDASGKLQPIRTTADWNERRASILTAMQEVMGPLPGEGRRVPLDVSEAESVPMPKFVRKKITYAAESGDRVPAYLLLPIGGAERRPAMLCLHQTTDIGKGEPVGLGGLPKLRYAQELAERGYVCLVPDYPSFGDYQYDFDLGETAFAGVEVSGDKIGTSGTKVSWGFAGRLGAKVGEQGKLYGVAGYNTENCSSCNDDAFSAGAGYQQGLGKSFYVKGEYRHFFTSNGLPDADAVVAGVGMRF